MSNVKKLTIIPILAIMLMVTGFFAGAEPAITVNLKGDVVVFDQAPIIEDGRTLVPVRAIFENLGSTVEWYPETRTVVSTLDDTTIILELDSTIARVNDIEVKLDVPAKIVGGRTLVPLRFVGESFGLDVNWDGQNRKITMVTQKPKVLTVEEIAENIRYMAYIEAYNKEGELLGSGSGFFINKDGTVVTNYHVINKANQIKVTTSDNKVYSVNKVLGYSKERDIAVIKVNASKSFEHVVFGDSNDIKIGQAIVSIGTPLGIFKNTVSTGIVSSIRKDYRNAPNTKDIQITSPISTGSSGGCLLNMYGEVIGIIYAFAPDGQNLNFAIPINELQLIRTDMGYSVKEFYEKENVIIYSNARYEGDIVDETEHGFGRMEWEDGSYYEGDWVNGKRTGIGLYKWANGDVYVGEWNTGKEHGFGRLEWSSGDVYEGGWKYGLRSGFGILMSNNIYALKGNWENNAMNGFGIGYHPNGVLAYEGEFVNGSMEGKGKYYNENGSLIYDGEFKNGIYNGTGVFYSKDGAVIYSGDFQNGQFHGYGILYYIGGSVNKEGEWRHGEYVSGTSNSVNHELYKTKEKNLIDTYEGLVQNTYDYYDYLIRQMLQELNSRGMAMSSTADFKREEYERQRDAELQLLKEAFEKDLQNLKLMYGIN